MSSRLNLDLEDEKLLKDFKKFVNDIHDGKFRKFYRHEIRQAFKFYLAANHVANYPALIKKDNELEYLVLPNALHTHPSRSFDQTHVTFLIKFFKTYHDVKKEPQKSELIGFIKSALLIKDKRAVDGWLLFLEDIGWLKHHMDNIKIKLTDKSLFDLLGEDPTGTYRPYNDEISQIFNAKPILSDSRARIRRD